MLDQHLLSFRRVDVDAAGHHHVAEAVGDVNVAFLIHVGDFAEGEHARGDVGGGGLLRVVMVDDAPSGGVLEEQAPLRVGRQRVVVVVQNHRLEGRHRLAHRARMLQPLLGGDDAGAAHFAGAVGVHEHRPPPLDHRPLHVHRALGAGVRDANQGTAVVAGLDVIRQGQQAHEVGGHHDRVADLVFIYRLERLLSIESAQDDAGHAGSQGTGAGQRTGVVHGADHQMGASVPHRSGRQVGDVFGNRVTAGEHGGGQLRALGPPGGAGGVEQVRPRGQVPRRFVGGLRGQPAIPGRDAFLLAPANDVGDLAGRGGGNAPFGGLGADKQHAGARIVQDVGHLVGGEVEVDRHHRGAAD